MLMRSSLRVGGRCATEHFHTNIKNANSIESKPTQVPSEGSGRGGDPNQRQNEEEFVGKVMVGEGKGYARPMHG